MAKQEFRLDFCGRGITVETGEIAKQVALFLFDMAIPLYCLRQLPVSRQRKELISFH